MLKPVEDQHVHAAALAIVSIVGAYHTAETVHAEHERVLAGITHEQRAVLRRTRMAARLGSMRSGSADDHLMEACASEARWRNAEIDRSAR